MNISSLRFGHANNSSSSHSLIIVKGGVEENLEDIDNYDTGLSYGWGPFVLVSPAEKIKYLIAQFGNQMSRTIGPELAKLAMKSLFGRCNLKKTGAVDHQSRYSFPMTFDGTVNMQFLRELRDFILKPSIVVAGGNDNSGVDFQDDLGTKVGRGFFDYSITIKDEDHGHWILFQDRTGDKIRFSFDDKPIVKSTLPELVDLKITNSCSKGCKFCYMDSTPSGQHAERINIFHIVDVLREGGATLEIALGGGEPTEHPNFAHILEYINKTGMHANFSTAKIDWLDDPVFRHRVLSNARSFAYSVSSAEQVDKLASKWEELQLFYRDSGRAMGLPAIKTYRPAVQVVLGTISKKVFKEIYDACSEQTIQLTVLGFKAVGRARGKKPLDYSWVVDEINSSKTNKWVRVAVDTCVAAEFKDEFAAADIEPVLYETEEGKFSCFVDAVTNTIAPSSFYEGELRCKLGDIHEFTLPKLKQCFKKF